MKLIQLFLLITVLVLSCKSEEPETKIEQLKFDIDKCYKNSISEHLEISKIIPLETRSNSLIKDIFNIDINNNEYLIHDLDQNKILLFNNEGKFLTQIGDKGKGPKEYLKITDFYTNSKHDSIGIYDESSQKIIILDKKNRLLKQIRIKTYFRTFEIWNNKEIIFFNRNTNKFPENGKISNFCIYNFNGKLLKEDIFYNHTEGVQTSFLRKNDLYSLKNGSINVQLYMNDTIYLYNGGKLKTRYIFDFGKYNLPNKIKNEMLIESNMDCIKINELIKKSEYINNKSSNWLENNDFIFTSRGIGKPAALYYILINKKNSKSTILNFMSQDFVWRVLQEPIGITQDAKGSFLVFAIYPNSMINLNTKYKKEFEEFKSKYPNEGAVIQNAFANISLDQNPLLVFARLK